jgi:hypothetical protein
MRRKLDIAGPPEDEQVVVTKRLEIRVLRDGL